MSTYKTEGIIIRRNNFRESSLILGIYTKDYGKIEAVARSARKEKGKLKGHLELFLHTDLILAQGRNVDTITSSLAAENFLSLRNSLKLLFPAYYILELVDRITIEKYKDERIFHLLKKVLLFLDKLADAETKQCLVIAKEAPKIKRYLGVLFFQTSLLGLTGFSPVLEKCVFCAKPLVPEKNYFSFELGGIIGKECALSDLSAVSISDNTIKLIRLFQLEGSGKPKNYAGYLDECFGIMNRLKVSEKAVLDSIFLMNRFIEFNIEREIKAVNFI